MGDAVKLFTLAMEFGGSEKRNHALHSLKTVPGRFTYIHIQFLRASLFSLIESTCSKKSLNDREIHDDSKFIK